MPLQLSPRGGQAVIVASIVTLGGQSASFALDLAGIRYAALDQPRIDFALAPASDPTNPFFGVNGDGMDDIQLRAFYDTGASGIVLSEGFAEVLGIEIQEVEGQPVIFSDIGSTGETPFRVSEPLVLRLTDYRGLANDTDPVLINPANFTTAYPHEFGPHRVQIGPVGGSENPLISDLNVLGVPVMKDKVVVVDARPVDKAIDFFEGTSTDFDIFARTFVYGANETVSFNPGYDPADRASQPGIPTPNLTIATTYANFGRFTTLTPDEAEPPVIFSNPMIGPNPISQIDETVDSGTAPPVKISLGSLSSEGSWLFDTGAAASFVSTETAADLGVAYDSAAPLGSDTPRLTGVPLDRQFTLTVSGIGGEPTVIAGFYADELLLRTEQGDALNDADPNHLRYVREGDVGGAPVLVLDITVTDPDTNEQLTLDGIFGMNFLLPTTELLETGDPFLPILPYNMTRGPFDFFTFDETTGQIGIVIPEPAALGVLGVAVGALLRRRRQAS